MSPLVYIKGHVQVKDYKIMYKKYLTKRMRSGCFCNFVKILSARVSAGISISPPYRIDIITVLSYDQTTSSTEIRVVLYRQK